MSPSGTKPAMPVVGVVLCVTRQPNGGLSQPCPLASRDAAGRARRGPLPPAAPTAGVLAEPQSRHELGKGECNAKAPTTNSRVNLHTSEANNPTTPPPSPRPGASKLTRLWRCRPVALLPENPNHGTSRGERFDVMVLPQGVSHIASNASPTHAAALPLLTWQPCEMAAPRRSCTILLLLLFRTLCLDTPHLCLPSRELALPRPPTTTLRPNRQPCPPPSLPPA